MPDRERMGNLIAQMAGNPLMLEQTALKWADRLCELSASVATLQRELAEAKQENESLSDYAEAAKADLREERNAALERLREVADVMWKHGHDQMNFVEAIQLLGKFGKFGPDLTRGLEGGDG